MTMVERVARALYEVRTLEAYPPQGGPEAASDRDLARAALLAMREPTHSMLHAGFCVDATPVNEQWRVMIDAALGEQ